jgi:hypothetical protein
LKRQERQDALRVLSTIALVVLPDCFPQRRKAAKKSFFYRREAPVQRFTGAYGAGLPFLCGFAGNMTVSPPRRG